MNSIRIVRSQGERHRAIANVWGVSDRLARKRALRRVSNILGVPTSELDIIEVSGIIRRRVVVGL